MHELNKYLDILLSRTPAAKKKTYNFRFQQINLYFGKKREHILSPKDIVHKERADQPVTFMTTKC